MGGSTYSSDVFDKVYVDKTKGGKDFFARTADIKSGKIDTSVSAKLDPSKKNKAGLVIRESRDSDVHPNSLAIACCFDVTGSMSNVPRIFVQKLGSFMSMLTSKGYVKNPHVLFGAIGDAYSDNVPLQMGQFEGGNEMDDVLSDMFLEGGGGGSGEESYELAMYFLARHAEMDCFEKRKKKGYLFLFGDEKLYPNVNAAQVRRIIGDNLNEDIPTKDIIKELQKKFNVYWILPSGTSGWEVASVEEPLKKLFGQNFIKLANPEDVCELLVSLVGVGEGIDVKSIEADLVAAGSSTRSAKNAAKAVGHLKV